MLKENFINYNLFIVVTLWGVSNRKAGLSVTFVIERVDRPEVPVR